MGHISVLRAMAVWGIGTIMSIAGAAIIGWQMMQRSPSIWVLYGVFFFLAGLIVVIINQVVFKVRKTQLEIDSDEAIKRLESKVEKLEEKAEGSE